MSIIKLSLISWIDKSKRARNGNQKLESFLIWISKMDIAGDLHKVYNIIYDLSLKVKEKPEWYEYDEDVEVIEDCEKALKILLQVFKYYKI